MEKSKLKQLVFEAQTGNDNAFEALYTEYVKQVRFIALKMTKNREDAEEISQDVFFYVHNKIAELRKPESFPAWLNRITINKCTNLINKKRGHVFDSLGETAQLYSADETNSELNPEKSLDNAETARVINEIIDRLPPPQKLCIREYYYEHLTIAQIASKFNINKNTVKSRLKLARSKIQEELTRLGKDDKFELYIAAPLFFTPSYETPTAGRISPAAKGLLSIAGMTAAAGIAAATFFVYTGSDITKDDNENPDIIFGEPIIVSELASVTGNSAGNIDNFGNTAMQDDWIYYINSDDCIYKIRNDSSEKTQLSYESGGSLNVVGNWIYYCSGDGSNNICKMRLDGSDKTAIFSEITERISVVGDWVYYRNDGDGGKLYRIRADGTMKAKLTDNKVDFINIADDWVYYTNTSENNKLYKMRTDGSDKTLVNDEWTDYPNIIGDWIYYGNGNDNGFLYKIRIDGSDKMRLNSKRSDRINVADGWIYYVNGDAGGGLYKIRDDGSEEILMNDDKCWDINIAGDWIYYRNKSAGDSLYKMRIDGTENQKVD